MKNTHGDVWQDRRVFQRARRASFQASPAPKSTGAHRLDTNSDRGKKHLPRRNTVQAVGWVERPISSLIDKKAEEWHLTRSKTIDRLIRMGLAKDFFREYETLITDAVSRAVAREHREDRNRLGAMLVRLSVRVSQLFYLIVNLLGRSGSQRRVTAEQLDKIIDWSRTEARQAVVKRTPEAEDLDRAVAAWLATDSTSKRGGEKGKEDPPN
jgi:hypothetical protein